MADTDTETMRAANAAVLDIDIRYREADFAAKRELKSARDAAFNTYSAARANLMAEGVISTDDDVAEMEALRQEVNEAADTQQLIIASGRLIGAMAKFLI